MKRFSGVLWLVFCAVGGAYAQGRPSEPKPDQAPIVELVGCLSQTGADWILAERNRARCFVDDVHHARRGEGGSG